MCKFFVNGIQVVPVRLIATVLHVSGETRVVQVLTGSCYDQFSEYYDELTAKYCRDPFYSNFGWIVDVYVVFLGPEEDYWYPYRQFPRLHVEGHREIRFTEPSARV